MFLSLCIPPLFLKPYIIIFRCFSCKNSYIYNVCIYETMKNILYYIYLT
nr:MAG TPA: DNA-directed RNA polymerase [Bacteriophage sp.]